MSSYPGSSRRPPRDPDSSSSGFSWGPLAVVGAIVAVVIGISFIGWLGSWHGTDSGEVCVIREGGPFDGRALKDVRQPAEGPKPIGAWNHQDCMPVTERDSNDVIEDQDPDKAGFQDPKFPTRDSVQVVETDQTLFSFTTDEHKVKTFMRKYGRRQWGGKDITDAGGLLNFMRQRLQPVFLDARREVLGTYDCTALNNLCVYVQEAAADQPTAAKPKGKTKAKAKTPAKQAPPAAAVTQNLEAAKRSLAAKIKAGLHAAFGDDYFENIRVQNMRIGFEPEVTARITRGQSLRTEARNARLEAQKKVAVARGEASRRVAAAEGARKAAFKQARAYRLNPTQRDLDRIQAFCGERWDDQAQAVVSKGCNPQVMGNLRGVIANLGGNGR